MGVEDWNHFVPVENRDGMVDIPTIPPIRVAAGADIDGFAAVYADILNSLPTVPTDGFIPLWLIPATPSDEQVMRPIVEAAMRADGMAVPLRPIIPTLRHLIADQTEQEHHG